MTLIPYRTLKNIEFSKFSSPKRRNGHPYPPENTLGANEGLRHHWRALDGRGFPYRNKSIDGSRACFYYFRK